MSMTAAELIEELKRMPGNQSVRLVVVDGGYCMAEDCGLSSVNTEAELFDVSFQGNHIRLEGR